ncbi:MAG: lipoprotein cytochrome c 5 heme-binding [Geobacteraceae bacterium]|nr:MAG: lipoprotein cytochrome c 5 heme-binding [Geobacteraceae bacterium]
MTFPKLFLPVSIVAGIMTITACSHIFSTESSLPAAHPEAVGEGRVACSECHEDQIKGVLKPYATFNHSQLFVKEHRFYAGSNDKLCASCHATSFCNDCHANELEIKPSIKLGDRPDRELIHRGDYMTRHKIDGKIDPTSCFRCHGRANNEQCIVCHK